MTKLIDIYRLVDNVETLIYSVSIEDTISYQGIMDKDKVTVDIVTEDPIYLQEGDYIYQDSVKYKINRDPEDKQKSDKEHSYTINFEAPIYTLIDKYYCSRITGDTTITLTGKLRDFLELLIWNINKDNNPLGVDTGWAIGVCPDTDYMNITLTGVKCRDVLDTFATKFGLEYYVNNKTVNYVSHIENETGLIFTQGQGGGLYEVERKNVDDGDLVTRVYAKGGTDNVIPGEGDPEGRLVLPEKYIENFSESNRGVEAVVEFDNIYPTFQGAVETVSGDNNREFICSGIDFNVSDLIIDDTARVNFLTGDLMGKSFEFKWNNTEKKITLIYQEDTLASVDTATGTRPNIPSASKYLRGGELFNFTGIKLSGTYKTNAITKLRQKATEWLAYYCRKRVKFELEVDYRHLRENNITLNCGDLITINVPLHNISKLIRITSIEKNLYTGKLTCIVSNYLDEKWKDKIETEVANIKSSTTTVNGGIGGASSVTILEKNDDREASDLNVFSSFRALKEIADRALSKTLDDSTAGFITFISGLCSNALAELNKGATFGNYVPDLNGSGAKISENGAAEMRSLKLWEFLEVPELRYNRITVNVGDKWNAPGGGVIKEVDTVNKIITLKLEDGEIGAVAVDDICKGIFHSSNLAENATSNTDDSKGNTTFAGFATCYFRVTEILDTANNSRFSYELRPISDNYPVQYNPSAFMNFVGYANFTNTDRQTSNYETRTYKRYLRNMNTWEISQANIAAQFGDLSNLSIHGLNMTGYSAYLNNIYMSGTIQQFELQEPLRMELNSDIGWLIAPGDQMNISANVFKGWVDISASAASWVWTRDSGNSVEDTAWNNAHTALTTSGVITYDDLPINSTLFTVTATFIEGTEVVTATKTFTI